MRLTKKQCALGLAMAVHALAFADTPPTPTTPAKPPAVNADATAASTAAVKPAAEAPSDIKPYDKVVTADAKTQAGLIKLHTIKGKLYFELPKALINKPLLMVANATAVPANVDHVGKSLNEDVVRFTVKSNRVYLQIVSHSYVSAPDSSITPAVKDSQRDAILAVFPVEAYAKDGAPVFEVSRLFTSEVGDFSARSTLRAAAMDSSRSYIDRSKAFASSVRVDAVQTYGLTPTPVPTIPGLPPLPTPPIRSATVDVAYNIVQLPEQPMKPRLADDRVGFFGLSQVDFGTTEHGVKTERLIARWRLEKADPDAAISKPVKPVVWYIDKSTPAWLVPYVKKGVEAWNVAFEGAGFKDAIQARPFPTKEEDPEFDPEDVRYSVIRWVPSKIPNAYGPHLSDPRSGEILNANIVMYHNIMQLQRDWYVTQAGAVDPRAQKLPLPDDLMGDLVAYVVTHEVGHSLGFPHNMKSSSLYPANKLRDPKWLKEMGHVATLMDYSRINYLVQPEDKIDPQLLIPKIGPYDVFATHWGYAPIPSAKTPEEELPILRTWIREQDSKPWLRFSAVKKEDDFGELTEAVGDADPVYATSLGIKNLQRIVKQLPAMAIKADRDDRTLEELYGATWSQWQREIGHVVSVVGGYDSQNKHGDQTGAIFSALPKERQKQAVKFLGEQVFQTPTWLFEPAITQRLRPSEPAARLAAAQQAVLNNLISRSRSNRLIQQEAAAGDKAYTLAELLSDLRGSVYGDATTQARRTLQRNYLNALTDRLNASGNDDSKAYVRAEIKTLKSVFAGKAAGAQKAHWDELADLASRALDPHAVQAPAATPALLLPRALGTETEVCWPEH
ncbi:zinc-dependent metalloprotease [Undibacterium rugosum]|uniref:zinc-dependent metalloprotease n=1 Tax=Undibacterium rugosum TaxID=2762291 RepID=UPI001BB0297C|nr:zinc-dependent metalloprotease [Undibacterium rugosum]